MSKLKRLIFDLETAPNVVLSWRTGYKINIDHDNIIRERAIICASYKWEGSRKTHCLEWNKGCDKQLLEDFMEVANEADELVAHNCDRFDIKWINTRLIANGLPPMPIWKTVDTLKVAKKHFNFNSNKLDYLAKLLLGEGKIHTDFGMWKDITLDNCAKSMRKMVKYAKKDVELLERVWKKLEPFHAVKTHVGAHMDGEKWTCPWTGSENVKRFQRRTTARGTVQHEMISLENEGHYTINDTAYKAFTQHLADQAEERKAEEIQAAIENINKTKLKNK